MAAFSFPSFSNCRAIKYSASGPNLFCSSVFTEQLIGEIKNNVNINVRLRKKLLLKDAHYSSGISINVPEII